MRSGACFVGIVVGVWHSGGAALAHPWHRHRAKDAPAHAEASTDDDSPADRQPADARFVLTAANNKPATSDFDIAAAFAAFEKLGQVQTRRDEKWFYVESNGIPDHPLMVGIRAWQQQVPLPQKYTGDNAWQIPLHPVRAKTPATTKNRFLRGAIALAVNGIPIFNPLNNRGEDALAIGELDEFGGHCGRADDYHYHVAPVHLEKIVGKGMPIAYALDGYPVYGSTEPDGSPLKPLDELGGHDDGEGGYHYHALKEYPYLIGGFRGEVIERDGQVDPQPRAQGVREALPALRGATIVGFESPAADTRRVVYEIGGRRGSVEYTVAKDGSARFTFTDPAGRTTTEAYTPRRRGPGGGPPREDRGPPRGGGGRREDPKRLATVGIEVTSPAVGPDGSLPIEFTCDGAGISPPIEWQAGPAGTRSYALSLWHETPDGAKSYWLLYDIPANVTKLPKDSRAIGSPGLNGKRRAEYDPMCSKGPGLKEYHVTVYALSARPQLRPEAATREALLEAIANTTLAEGTLTFAYERKGRR
jgi:phosphatidylethanolamine-binding protein (PEBP) family uncharacterized protein